MSYTANSQGSGERLSQQRGECLGSLMENLELNLRESVGFEHRLVRERY